MDGSLFLILDSRGFYRCRVSKGKDDRYSSSTGLDHVHVSMAVVVFMFPLPWKQMLFKVCLRPCGSHPILRPIVLQPQKKDMGASFV